MPEYIEAEAPPEFRAKLTAIETLADAWFSKLALSTRPWNLAYWAVLTTLVEMIEVVIHERGFGSAEHRIAMINLGLNGPVALKECTKDRGHVELEFRSDPILSNEAKMALNGANQYTSFLYTFPLWYRGRMRAEIIGENHVRFVAIGGARDRQVAAWQKGFRAADSPRLPDDPRGDPFMPNILQSHLLNAALETCRPGGDRSFFYPRPFLLLESLQKKYLQRLNELLRRDSGIALGSYTLGEFASFYAAFLALCGVHEHLCFLWGRTHQYPLNSAVLVKSRKSWTENCSRLSGVAPDKVSQMILDITFGSTRPLDLHIHPFVGLAMESDFLGVIPHFPLYSKW
ncbi:MAG TPA: hypothetical protein VHW72_12980, partial [Candidatus Angelobacter sp.]|nr:hypothetical protein [Candidatus Angelobacter sp.]